jgi:hypothetical protein
VPHQSDFDKPDSAAMGVALVYHNLCDGVLEETQNRSGGLAVLQSPIPQAQRVYYQQA